MKSNKSKLLLAIFIIVCTTGCGIKETENKTDYQEQSIINNDTETTIYEENQEETQEQVEEQEQTEETNNIVADEQNKIYKGMIPERDYILQNDTDPIITFFKGKSSSGYLSDYKPIDEKKGVSVYSCDGKIKYENIKIGDKIKDACDNSNYQYIIGIIEQVMKNGDRDKFDFISDAGMYFGFTPITAQVAHENDMEDILSGAMFYESWWLCSPVIAYSFTNDSINIDDYYLDNIRFQGEQYINLLHGKQDATGDLYGITINYETKLGELIDAWGSPYYYDVSSSGDNCYHGDFYWITTENNVIRANMYMYREKEKAEQLNDVFDLKYNTSEIAEGIELYSSEYTKSAGFHLPDVGE